MLYCFSLPSKVLILSNFIQVERNDFSQCSQSHTPKPEAPKLALRSYVFPVLLRLECACGLFLVLLGSSAERVRKTGFEYMHTQQILG